MIRIECPLDHARLEPKLTFATVVDHGDSPLIVCLGGAGSCVASSEELPLDRTPRYRISTGPNLQASRGMISLPFSPTRGFADVVPGKEYRDGFRRLGLSRLTASTIALPSCYHGLDEQTHDGRLLRRRAFGKCSLCADQRFLARSPG